MTLSSVQLQMLREAFDHAEDNAEVVIQGVSDEAFNAVIAAWETIRPRLECKLSNGKFVLPISEAHRTVIIEHKSNSVWVMIHHGVGAHERQPHGYVLGRNLIIHQNQS